MKFFYACWIAEQSGFPTRGSVVVCDEKYFNVVNLMNSLSKAGQISPVVVSFQEIERDHVLLMMGEEALNNMEISFRRSQIKSV
jgi:hypothetical protein